MESNGSPEAGRRQGALLLCVQEKHAPPCGIQQSQEFTFNGETLQRLRGDFVPSYGEASAPKFKLRSYPSPLACARRRLARSSRASAIAWLSALVSVSAMATISGSCPIMRSG